MLFRKLKVSLSKDRVRNPNLKKRRVLLHLHWSPNHHPGDHPLRWNHVNPNQNLSQNLSWNLNQNLRQNPSQNLRLRYFVIIYSGIPLMQPCSGRNGLPSYYDTTAVGLSVFLPVHCIAVLVHLFGKCLTIISPRCPKGTKKEKKGKSITKRM